MVLFNIIATVGTSEATLTPYPSGTAAVPNGKNRYIYTIVLNNTSTGSNTLTFRIYKSATLESSFTITIPSTGSLSLIGSDKAPILVVPSGRTLKAVASASSIDVVMTAEDK